MSDFRTTDLMETALGFRGAEYIDGTDEVVGNFIAIQFLDDTVIDAIAGNIAGLDGESFEAGTIIYGRFTSIELVSGRVLAYKGV
jgi:hypothetical protein